MTEHDGPGVADVLVGEAHFAEVVQRVPLQVDAGGPAPRRRPAVRRRVGGQFEQARESEIALVTAGSRLGSISSILSPGQMRTALSAVPAEYEVVIVDSPALLAVADVLTLLSEVDGVLLVTRLDVSTHEAARRLRAEIERVPGANVIGVVVNGVPPWTYRVRGYGYSS